jgi:hypothetical protein
MYEPYVQQNVLRILTSQDRKPFIEHALTDHYLTRSCRIQHKRLIGIAARDIAGALTSVLELGTSWRLADTPQTMCACSKASFAIRFMGDAISWLLNLSTSQ